MFSSSWSTLWCCYDSWASVSSLTYPHFPVGHLWPMFLFAHLHVQTYWAFCLELAIFQKLPVSPIHDSILEIWHFMIYRMWPFQHYCSSNITRTRVVFQVLSLEGWSMILSSYLSYLSPVSKNIHGVMAIQFLQSFLISNIFMICFPNGSALVSYFEHMSRAADWRCNWSNVRQYRTPSTCMRVDRKRSWINKTA